jgi:hypothetical protein
MQKADSFFSALNFPALRISPDGQPLSALAFCPLVKQFSRHVSVNI